MASTGEKKLVRSKSGLRMVTVDEKIQSPFTMAEPEWTPDVSCKVCQNVECQAKFDLFNRKHHCRRCGKCFCNKCTSCQVTLPRMCFVDPVRHCDFCLNITKKENEFFDRHLKVLLNGSVFSILDNNSNPEEEEVFTCRLSQDHRKLEFLGEQSKRESIPVDKIESVQIMASESDQQGNRLGTGIAIRYTVGTGPCMEVEMVKMTVEEGAGKKNGMAWIAAMQKAFKMIYESKNP
ncbi:zinc finger FYVE domain-containing protein 21-like [Babylonia areolata]|uniref:zinc finger FYVE domain-containing protein 21-like n=1 Tax=Babylonia areolata TaxID=304850 RepID=UPI003FD5F85F